jgi:hypothetical protein
MIYQDKYLKYKKKYIELKKYIGGDVWTKSKYDEIISHNLEIIKDENDVDFDFNLMEYIRNYTESEKNNNIMIIAEYL